MQNKLLDSMSIIASNNYSTSWSEARSENVHRSGILMTALTAL